MRRRHSKLSRKQRRIKSRVTFRTLFLLSITLIFNTYAWFLYTTTVSTSMTAHVDAWKVEFEVDDEVVDREFTFAVAHAYPGMPDNVKELVVRNNGEKRADITYEIQYIRIFEDEYISTERVAEGVTPPVGATQMSAAALLTKIQNDYPFYFEVETPTGALEVNEDATLVMTFGWDYESGDDATDTNYGTTAYDFYEDNPDTPAIQIILKVTVTQHRD